MIETGLYTVLAAYASAYPSYLPERRSLPAITYSRVSTVRDQTHDGATGLVHARFQLTVHAATFEAAQTLASTITRSVRDGGLNGRAGAFGTTLVDHTEIVNETDLGFRPETDTHQIAVDAIVHYQE